MITYKWEIDETFSGQMLRFYLRDEKQISRTALTDIKFHGGTIRVNGLPVTVRYVLQKGDVVEVQFPPEKRSEYILPVDIPLDIIYEDDHFLVINKQPKLPTIPSRLEPNLSLANAVLFYYGKMGIDNTFHAVNRLDKDTSGLVLIAKHRYAHDLLSRQQKGKTFKRSYKALVHGVITQNDGTIEAPIGRKSDSIIEREVRFDGKKAMTKYKVENRFTNSTLISLSLLTGRTHQIRVHMAYLGFPLVGDDLYGGTREVINRQALHSDKMVFYHPFKEKEVSFFIPLPADIISACPPLQ